MNIFCYNLKTCSPLLRSFVCNGRNQLTRTIMFSPLRFSSDFIFRQLFDSESSTYTYLLGDIKTKECVLIDPVLEKVDRDVQLIKELNLNLIYAMNTHMHADHVTGTGLLKKVLPGCKSVISKASGANADKHITAEDRIEFGSHVLAVLPTPGHTNGCVTYLCEKEGVAFTGDTLLIRGCGRTDFQEGNPATLYDSVYTHIFSLPDYFKLFPAHDYKGYSYTTVEEEKKYNPRLTKSKEEFIDIMNNLNLPYPKKIGTAPVKSTPDSQTPNPDEDTPLGKFSSPKNCGIFWIGVSGNVILLFLPIEFVEFKIVNNLKPIVNLSIMQDITYYLSLL